jgi:hypothetical protein
VVNVFDEETRIPRLFPPPLEYTLMVDPFRELNENDPGDKAPVPDALTPATSDVPV